jgi:hypothetical protein
MHAAVRPGHLRWGYLQGSGTYFSVVEAEKFKIKTL